MFESRTDLNRRSSGGNLRSGLLRGNGLERLCIDVCTFLFLDHLVISEEIRIAVTGTYQLRNFLHPLTLFAMLQGRTACQL